MEEYLRSSYEPDVDYVDGYLEDRNVGENQHSDLRGELLTLLRTMGRQWGIYVFPEQRVQVKRTRFRVPDVCVMPRAWTKEQVIHQPPMLCIEVLSPADTFSKMQTKCRDYFEMGVPEVWIFDVEEGVVSVVRPAGTTERREGLLQLEGTLVEVDIDALFAAVNEGRWSSDRTCLKFTQEQQMSFAGQGRDGTASALSALKKL